MRVEIGKVIQALMDVCSSIRTLDAMIEDPEVQKIMSQHDRAHNRIALVSCLRDLADQIELRSQKDLN